MPSFSAWLFANAISLLAALCLGASCIASHPKRIFLFQFSECVLLAGSQLLFGRPIGAMTLLIGAVRNLLVAYRRYNKGLMWAFVLISVCFPLLGEGMRADVYTRAVDLLPVLATVQFTVFSYYAASESRIKLSILATLLLWTVYAFLIGDLATAISNAVLFVLDLVVLIRLARGGDSDVFRKNSNNYV